MVLAWNYALGVLFPVGSGGAHIAPQPWRLVQGAAGAVKLTLHRIGWNDNDDANRSNVTHINDNNSNKYDNHCKDDHH